MSIDAAARLVVLRPFMRSWVMRFSFLFLAMVCLGSAVRADRAQDLARIHIEAIGGRERIEKLKSLRATGTAVANGKQVRFTMIAARPAKIRLETEAGGRTLVQASDGDEPAWEFDTGTWPPQYRTMPEANARTFVADAEFDDPLVAGESRGFTLDYAGEVEIGGKKLLRLLVTRRFKDVYSLLIDEETYFIAMRVEERRSAGGRLAQLVTAYDDFRPVDGVLLPHQITVQLDGRVTQQTRITRIDGNPKIAEDTFTRPKVTAPPAPKGGN